jgi:hypothetical protein
MQYRTRCAGNFTTNDCNAGDLGDIAGGLDSECSNKHPYMYTNTKSKSGSVIKKDLPAGIHLPSRTTRVVAVPTTPPAAFVTVSTI